MSNRTEERLGMVESALERIEAMLLGKADRLVVRVGRSEGVEKNPDYVAFGSPEHAAFLGVVEIESAEAAALEGFEITYKSPKTGKTYRLMDELTPFDPHHDPKAAAMSALRQKVSSLESGPPTVPADAPPLWSPGLGVAALSAMGLPPGAVVVYDDDEPCGTVSYA